MEVGAGVVAGEEGVKVFLNRGGAGTFPTNFFKVYHFYISKLLCSLQNYVMHLKKNCFFKGI